MSPKLLQTTLQATRNAFNFNRPLSSAIARSLTSVGNKAAPSQSQIDHGEKTAIEISQIFDAHPARHHPLFDFLQEEVKGGLTPAQYDVFSRNFAARTTYTVMTVAEVIKRAIQNGDFETASKTGKNLFEETGSGKLEDMHLGLLSRTLNFHGERVFGLREIDILKIEPSLLLPATIKYCQAKKRVLASSTDYNELLGNMAAHEGAADEMLMGFRCVFEAFRGYYAEAEFKQVMKYFDEHRDDSKEGGDVEAQHKEAALKVIAKAIAVNPKVAAKILRGGKDFLDAQNYLWTELLSGMEKARSSGYRIPPKSDFREEVVAQEETPAEKKIVVRTEAPLHRDANKTKENTKRPKADPRPLNSKPVSAEDVKLTFTSH